VRLGQDRLSRCARRLRIIARRTLALILIKPAKKKLDDNYKRCRGYVKTTYLREDLTMTKPIDAEDAAESSLAKRLISEPLFP
jgi:hypothetical protein